MKALVQFAFLGFLLVLVGCTLLVPKETLYLQAARDVATQAEVRERLGAPRTETSVPGGESRWVYEVRELEPGSQNTWASAGSWCDEYVLTFDNSGVLRQWTHASYFHGGETMPIRCDAGTQRAAL